MGTVLALTGGMRTIAGLKLVLVFSGLAACAPVSTLDDLDETDPGESQKAQSLSSYAPCGTPLAEVDGVWTYSNGQYTTTGTSCAGTSEIGASRYQCVELVQRYFAAMFGAQPLWPVAAAKEMCDAGRHPVGTEVHWVGDGYVPRRGDAVIWRSGTWGHAAVVRTVWSDGIEIVEQNNSAEGVRILYGDATAGYASSPSCFVTAGGATESAAPAEAPASPEPPAQQGGSAQCDALGYVGACSGSVAVWSEGGTCFVRDCAAESKTCGWISDSVGYGCLQGSAGSTAFDCAALGYEGGCFSGTVVWVENGACTTYDCSAAGLGCGWDGANGYNCL